MFEDAYVQWEDNDAEGGVIFFVITDGKFIYELPCRFVNNMETVSQARMGSYHGKNENSNWKYVEPDLTFISCLSPDAFFGGKPKEFGQSWKKRNFLIYCDCVISQDLHGPLSVIRKKINHT